MDKTANIKQVTIPIPITKLKTTARTNKGDYPHPNHKKEEGEEFKKLEKKLSKEFTNKKTTFKKLEKRFTKKLEGTQSKIGILHKWVINKNYNREKIIFREFEIESCFDTKTSYKYRNWLLFNKLISKIYKSDGYNITKSYLKLLVKYHKQIMNKCLEIEKW